MHRGGVSVKNKQITALLYGWIVTLGLILVASVLLAIFIRFTALNDSLISTITLSIGLIALFIGGLVAGIKGKHKGWIIGGLIGIGFSLFTFLVQYLGYDQVFTFKQSLHHGGYILAALIGGVLGVNFVEGENTE